MSKKIVLGILLILSMCFLFFNSSIFSGKETSAVKSQGLDKSTKNQDIDSAIISICLMIQANDRLGLQNVVTEVPDIYIERYYRAVQEKMNLSDEEFKKLRTKKPNTISIDPFRRTFDRKEDLVEYALFSLDFITERNARFIKIINSTENGNEAKATVSFGKDAANVSNHVILLSKVEGEWKVFNFQPEDATELYKVSYGEPNL